MLPQKQKMSLSFNYRHLYYFWVVAKEGGISRAAVRLDMAVQTVSAQVRELERSLGQALLRPAGRGLVLTEAGQAALRQADLIFQLGEQLPAAVRDRLRSPVRTCRACIPCVRLPMSTGSVRGSRGPGAWSSSAPATSASNAPPAA